MKVKKILVSQPAPSVIEKSPFYEISQKHGVEVDFRPFIKVVGVSLKEFRSQRVEILDHSAVIFTSRTTVDSFFRICEEARVAVPETMKYFCNTEAIALYLQKYIVYRKRKIFFADGKFDTFMELLLRHRDERMLLTLTEPNNGEIPNTMERLKFHFSRVTLAKTVSADLTGVDVRGYDILAFYSPAEITSLVSIIGKDDLPKIATFGNGTASAASAAGLAVSAMAPIPEVPSMVKAVDILIGKIHGGLEVKPVVVQDDSKSEEFLKAQESKPSRRARARKKSEPATASNKIIAAIKSAASKGTSANGKSVASKSAASSGKVVPAKPAASSGKAVPAKSAASSGKAVPAKSAAAQKSAAGNKTAKKSTGAATASEKK